MSTLFAQPDDKLLSAGHRKPKQEDSETPLSFTVSVNADRRRIFQLLTIAEYMETWLHVPGRHKESPIRVASDPKGFHIEYIDETGNATALVGSYQTCRTSKTNVLWRRKGACESHPSFVKIRLDGDFERTTLSLTHRGFNSDEDRRWHALLWERSLQKLSSLFELQ